MSDPATITTRDESPVFFDSGDETLFGILTTPTDAKGVAVVFLYGGGHNMSAHVGGIWARAARHVAGLGFHAFRFDHHGNGDSTGRTDSFDHRAPYTEDLEAAVEWLRGEGLERFVLVGDCLGARADLAAGVDMAGLEGMFLMSAMVWDSRMGRAEEWADRYGLAHYIRRAFQWQTIRRLADPEIRRSYVKVAEAKSRSVVGRLRGNGVRSGDDQGTQVTISRGFIEPLRAVLGRGARVNFVFGSLDTERRGDFDAAKSGSLGDLLDAAGSQVEETTIEGRLAAHMDMTAQNGFVEALGDWLQTF